MPNLDKSKKIMSDKLQGTAYDKHCQRRICKRSDQPKKKLCIKAIDCKADTTGKTFRDTDMTRTDKAGSQLYMWTALSLLLEPVSSSVAKICNASQEPTHIN